MKKLTIALLLFALSAFTSWAGDFQKGVSAYKSGDYKTAFKEFVPLAEQGNVDAQFNLALSYANGQGVPQDYIRAHMWWNLAASSGNKNAVAGRDAISKQMTPDQIAEAQKLARECVRKKYKGC